MKRKKKKNISILILGMILLGGLCVTIAAQASWPGVNAIDEQEIMQVLNAMFDALKSGDTGALKSIFAGEMYEINKALLEQNTEYPGYLRNHYQGAVFTIVEMAPIEKGVIADINVLLSTNREQDIRLLLEKRDFVDSIESGSALSDLGSLRWAVVKHIQDR